MKSVGGGRQNQDNQSANSSLAGKFVRTNALKRPIKTRQIGKPANFTEGPVTRKLLAFAFPILAGNVLQSLNGTVNQFWVSRLLGESAIAAVGNGNAIMALVAATVFGVAIASSILLGHAMGTGNYPAIKRIMANSAVFFLTLAGVVAIVGYCTSDAMLTMLGADRRVHDDATIYLRTIFLSVPFTFFFSFIYQAQNAIGDSKTPFYFLTSAVILDALLNPLLIQGIWPFPRLGVAGAALSTLLAQGISLLTMLFVLYRTSSPISVRASDLKNIRMDSYIIKSLLLRGIPMGMQMIVTSSAAVTIIGLVNHYGASTTAAYVASTQVWSYVQMPTFAIAASVTAMAALNIGARKWDRVDKIVQVGIISALIITSIVALLFYASDQIALRLFLPADSDALQLAKSINNRVLWGFISFGVTLTLSGAIRAAGKVWPPLIILAVSMYMVRIPVAYWLASKWGVRGLWWSFPLSAASASLMMIVYYARGNWRDARIL
jgi:putative MATE family efflux protein